MKQWLSISTKFKYNRKGHYMMDTTYLYWVKANPTCDSKDQAILKLLVLNPFVLCSSFQLLTIQKDIHCTVTGRIDSRNRHFNKSVTFLVMA